MAARFHAVGRIRTNTISDENQSVRSRRLWHSTMAVLAKISRDGELLDSLKPLSMKNDVIPGVSKTPRSSSSGWKLRRVIQVWGRAIHVEGRKAQIEILGSLQAGEVNSVTTFGKANLTSAEVCRENVILAILKGESTLLSHPFVKAIWFPKHSICWLRSDHLKPKIPIYCANLKVNPSQERAIEKILSASDTDRVVLIQGPSGNLARQHIISCSAARSRTVWVAAQSNVAVKNIAEKFAKIGFYDFVLLVSKEFHFDWQLRGARVILCTLGMLSNNLIAPFLDVNPVDILIFDEGSQIEVGNYLPVFHRFKYTLMKVVFIGDNKQLFEVNHLQENVVFLDTQSSLAASSMLKEVRKNNQARVGLLPLHTKLRGLDFRIITPYDAQRSLIEHELQAVNVRHEDKVFNIDSFQVAEHSVCGPAASTLVGQLARALGPQVWEDGEMVA
ncbi:hypothetical protein EDC04DRAFT_2603755 [Pisolithus marmoratus]|nr:hypothetical protein EDC04DRAFT_2603755 [Pisolithus marmoratus]